MKKGIYSVFDEKALVFGMPMVFIRDEEAIRSLTSLVNSKGTMLNMYPSDYKFYKIGSIDDVSGEIVSCKPEFLKHGLDVLLSEGGEGAKKVEPEPVVV